ncbi:hypothetical protein SAMN05660772_00417 [Pasteurella testudinis DSM 23072]|uniref:Uncharacterized protein n=1 Tax=Pasteurella testudinis DSM 23072 TaxID=1122938 RepID=A0A1W1UEN0_9PAST|nr:hypothetical protein [Pasteurella testudinis]SMB79558.1 hypothetical protein SAMN05660772_00417 [Pasteurella testudinis DSM 23072]SUB50721.1 Uncharacterised protein [Pasteurella testudinis]
MLTIQLQQQSYSLPLAEGLLSGYFTLDENWRDLDYANGGNALFLDLVLTYRVPRQYIDDFYRLYFIDLEERSDGYVIDEDNLPLLRLEIPINRTEFDFEHNKTIILGNLPRFPQLTDLAHQKLDNTILEKSGFFFSSFANAQLAQFEFGQAGAQAVDLTLSGKASDGRGELHFQLTESQIPFKLAAKIIGYADQFVGKDIEARAAEIRACFADIYDQQHYIAESVQVSDQQYLGIEITFRQKHNVCGITP